LTICTVSSSLATPCRARKWACMGMNPKLKVGGVVLTMFDAQTKLSNEVVAELKGFIDSAKGKPLPWADAKVFNTRIRRNIKLAESPSFGQTIMQYDATSNGALDYRNLARELVGMPPLVVTPVVKPAVVKPIAVTPAPVTVKPATTTPTAPAPPIMPPGLAAAIKSAAVKKVAPAPATAKPQAIPAPVAPAAPVAPPAPVVKAPPAPVKVTVNPTIDQTKLSANQPAPAPKQEVA